MAEQTAQGWVNLSLRRCGLLHLLLRYWNLIDKQSDHDSNRSISNPVEAKSQGAFIGSMRYRYAKKYNAH